MAHRVVGWILEQSVDGIQPPANPPVKYDGTETALTANAFSAPVWVERVGTLSIQVTTGAGSTLVGSFAIQGSNDVSNKEGSTMQADGQQTNWCPLTFLDEATGSQVQSKALASGAQSFIATIPVVSPRYIRWVFTFVSGSGSPIVKGQQKAVV